MATKSTKAQLTEQQRRLRLRSELLQNRVKQQEISDKNAQLRAALNSRRGGK
jgi:hypothetical protein